MDSEIYSPHLPQQRFSVGHRVAFVPNNSASLVDDL